MSALPKKEGFTLIELMTVVAIIGVLAAIAVPNFMHYRERTYDKQANTVLKNITSAQAAYNAKWEMYTSSVSKILDIDPNIPAPSTTMISWGINSATTTTFSASSTHNRGSGMSYQANQSSVITMF